MSDPESRYANYFRVGNNNFEFVIDFGEFRSGDAEPVWHWRAVVPPVFAKQLLLVLSSRIHNFERDYEPIPTSWEAKT
jgi:hypothetical protein